MAVAQFAFDGEHAQLVDAVGWIPKSYPDVVATAGSDHVILESSKRDVAALQAAWIATLANQALASRNAGARQWAREALAR
jgi:hypothetical protein